MKYQFIKKSANSKTGPIPVTYSQRETCPPSCAHYRSDCYAEDYYTRMNWDKVPGRGVDIGEFCQSIANLPNGQLWRHNVAGDLPGAGEKIDPVQLGAIVWANIGKRGFTYTHKTNDPENLHWISKANDQGFTVNLSGDDVGHADQLIDLGVGPVVCIVPMDTPEKTQTPAGRPIIVCPAQTRDNVTCENCQLCQRQNRAVIVGFRAHGTRAKIADQKSRRVIPIQLAGGNK
jgi:hypothetical protein